MTDTSPAYIFLVDDHPIVRDGFRQLLENEEGLAVAGEAGSREEALGKLSEAKADLAIVDISMGGMGGIELTRHLVESPEMGGSDLVVLVVSMHDEIRYVEDALEAGARGYVLKDNVHAVLPEAVHEVLGGQLYLDPELKDKIHLY